MPAQQQGDEGAHVELGAGGIEGPRLLGSLSPCGGGTAKNRSPAVAGPPEKSNSSLAAAFVHPDRVVRRQSTLRDAPRGCESVNFDLLESRQYVEYVMRRSRWAGRLKGGFRWLLLCLAGVGTGLVAVAIQFTLHHAWHLKHHVQHRMAEQELNLALRWMAWTGINLALSAVAGALVCFVEPLAAGSGIPEIKCYLNGIDMPGVLRARTLLCKAAGIVFSVAAGLPCGKEGPMIHSGAIVGAQMAALDAGPLTGPYRQNREARDLTAAGAAAGVAAAFGAPIGGVLFAVEEGATHMNPVILVRCFVCASVSAFTVRFFLGPLHAHSPFGVLGTNVPVEFGRFPERAYTVAELAVFAVMGCFGGLTGALFNGANRRLALWRKAHIGPTGARRFLEVLAVTASISTVAFFAPMLGGSSELSHYGLSQKLFVQPGNRSIKDLFHSDEDFDLRMLLFFAVLHYLEACWTYGVGVPSGLFVPSLLAGATWGRILGQLVAPLDHTKSQAGVYALIGATAALSGMARITISLAMILMETTGEAEWGLPIFITAVAAKWTGDLFNHGLYDIHIHLKKVPLLEGIPEKHMLLMQASDVMTREVLTLTTRASVEDLLALLGSCSHNGFPVLEPGSQVLAGMVERRTLVQLLALGKSHGVLEEPEEAGAPGDRPLVPYEAMLQRKAPSLREVKDALSPADGRLQLDLAPYVDASCFRVEEGTVLARCYVLFRGMGLRHLPVVGRDHTLRGIITRKDLIFDEHGEPGHPAPEPRPAEAGGAARHSEPQEPGSPAGGTTAAEDAPPVLCV